MRINLPETGQTRIVIVGAGFAGLELAKRLARSNYQIVLLDKNNYHQFQPLFYQVAMAGLEPSSISFPLRKLFQKHPNVFIRITEVESVDTTKKEIYTPFGKVWYDHLVLAIGADTNFFGNEHIARHAIPMKSVSEALFLRNAILDDYEISLTIDDMETRQPYLDVVVVGGGPTGVEVCGALSEMKHFVLPRDYKELDCGEIDIHLIQSSSVLLKGMSEKASATALKYLQDLGVQVQLNSRVVDYDGETVTMKDGSTIRTRKMIWAAGISANTIQGLPEDAITYGGRVKTDAFLRVVGVEDVYAIGDVAYLEESNYPKGHPQVAPVAIQMGRHVAKHFKRLQQGKAARPFAYKDKGAMATIGRNKAVVDMPRGFFRGFFAWLIWLVVHLFQLIGVKNRLFVFLNWVVSYITYDQSLRLIIRPKTPKAKQQDA